MPAVAIGDSVLWHNLRANLPKKVSGRAINKLSYVAGAGFADFKIIESGILTYSKHISLFAAKVLCSQQLAR